MDKYIRIQAAIDIVRHECGEWKGLAKEIAKQFNGLPAADVVPVRLGEWLDGYKVQTCSLCKCRGKKSWTFCPHCGARMIYGERKENGNEAD